MKKNVILLSLILIGFALISNATVWRLNNVPGVDADFTTNLQDAIDNVSSGDTIYVEQSPYNYGTATISKQVFLIGGGYWLEENDSTRVNIEESRVEELVFNSGSEGSVITGLYIYIFAGWYQDFNMIEINTDTITIQRNYIWGSGEGHVGDRNQIKINGNRTGVIIQQNWFQNRSGNPMYAIFIEGIPLNIVIRNNIIYSNSNGTVIEETIGGSSIGLFIKNNVMIGEIHTFNALYVNNILISGSFYNGSGGIVANNICNGTQFPDNNNNQQNVNMSIVFVDYDLYIDNGYILSSGSPAIGAGFNGGDCGVFGSGFGGNPYVLSGMAAIPAIFEIEFNSMIFPSSSNTLEVNLKAKSHN